MGVPVDASNTIAPAQFVGVVSTLAVAVRGELLPSSWLYRAFAPL